MKNIANSSSFNPTLRLPRIRRQQTRQALVQVKEEGDALGVRFVRLFAALALVGFVHGGVQLLVGFEAGAMLSGSYRSARLAGLAPV